VAVGGSVEGLELADATFNSHRAGAVAPRITVGFLPSYANRSGAVTRSFRAGFETIWK
jgi:hypothetical protein